MSQDPTKAAKFSGGEERLAYRPTEAASVLGLGRNRIFELLRSGELRSVKYGRTRLIPRTAIEEFLSGGPQAS